MRKFPKCRTYKPYFRLAGLWCDLCSFYKHAFEHRYNLLHLKYVGLIFHGYTFGTFKVRSHLSYFTPITVYAWTTSSQEWHTRMRWLVGQDWHAPRLWISHISKISFSHQRTDASKQRYHQCSLHPHLPMAAAHNNYFERTKRQGKSGMRYPVISSDLQRVWDWQLVQPPAADVTYDNVRDPKRGPQTAQWLYLKTCCMRSTNARIRKGVATNTWRFGWEKCWWAHRCL